MSKNVRETCLKKRVKLRISKGRKYVLHSIRIIGSLLLFFLVFRNFDWSAFLKVIPQITIWFYAYSLGLIFMGQLLYIWRWKFILSSMGLRISFGRLSIQYFIGIYFNNFLPGGFGGDISKSYYLGRSAGYLNIGTSVLADRIIGLFSLVILSVVMMRNLGLNSPTLAIIKNVVFIVFLSFILLYLVIIFVPSEFLIHRMDWLYRLSGNASERIMRFFNQMRNVVRKPVVLFAALGVSFSYLAIISVFYRDFFYRTVGIDYPFWPLLSTLTVIALLVNIPITINGIGLREQLHYFLFANLGLPKEVSVSISLVMFAHFVILSVVGLFLWLRLKHTEPSPESSSPCNL